MLRRNSKKICEADEGKNSITHQKTMASNIKILVAEDSRAQAQQIRNLLEEHGYNVTLVSNGKEALAAARKSPPSLIISDIVMPEMDGYRLCCEVKADNNLKKIPLILLTSLSDPHDVIKGLQCKADNFITKPYDEKNLLSLIQNILANKEPQSGKKTQEGLEVLFSGEKYTITSERKQILDFLLSTYETAVNKNSRLIKTQGELWRLNEQLDQKVKERTQALEAEVTERKESEKKLQIAEEEWRHTFDSMSDGVSIHDTEWNIVKANEALIKLLGMSQDELAGKKCYQLIHKLDEPFGNCPLARSKSSKKTEHLELFEPNLKRWLYVSCSPKFSGNGSGNRRMSGVVHVVRDVTERKQLEAQFLQSQKMEAIGQLAGGVAHDFNNLLTAIIGYAELIEVKIDEDNPVHGYLVEIRETVKRASSLTQQLLLFSRKQPLQTSVLSINSLLAGTEKMLRRIIGEDVELVTVLGQDLECVKADKGQLVQAIMNLAVNARDAMPEGGKITIRTENAAIDEEYCKSFSYARPGKFISLSVEDTGTGMDKETISHIFEPFFTTKQPGKGTGLGLSTVYGIVKQHEGWITVSSEGGKGSTFRVYFSSVSQKANEEIKVKEEIPLQTLQGCGERILFVEDDKGVSEFVMSALCENGYTVFKTGSAEEALDVFEKEKGNFQLILSDVVLPNKSGLELIEELLANKPDLRILLNSGYMDQKSKWQSISEKGFPFLQKPYNLTDLLSAVKNALVKEPEAKF